MAELVGLFSSLSLGCETVSLPCIICHFPPVGPCVIELMYVLLKKKMTFTSCFCIVALIYGHNS